MADPFALPPISLKTTTALRAVIGYIQERTSRQADARDIVKGLVQTHDAKLTYPSYRTALRCGDIYTEAASNCDLTTAKILIANFAEKAAIYLRWATEVAAERPLVISDDCQLDLFASLKIVRD